MGVVSAQQENKLGGRCAALQRPGGSRMPGLFAVGKPNLTKKYMVGNRCCLRTCLCDPVMSFNDGWGEELL